MRSAPDTARAGLLLSALLFLTSLPGETPEALACVAPAERAAVAGRTREVSCAGGAALRGPVRLLFGQPIDPNRADAETLEVLPGIGPSRAAAIVAARASRPYASVAELSRVPGIGPVTLARISPHLAVGASRSDTLPRQD